VIRVRIQHMRQILIKVGKPTAIQTLRKFSSFGKNALAFSENTLIFAKMLSLNNWDFKSQTLSSK
jgi:hypothetical protein